jgi:dihydroxy-acid dehydratase
MTSTPKKLRSSHWFAGDSKASFVHRAWMLGMGVSPGELAGRPVIGICNTWSELTPCNSHLRELAEYVKQGVREAGGLPLEFPVMSLGESNMRPTAMLYRNLASMDVEETLRANPVDGVVLLAGCDKTTPALLMGAASCDLPSVLVSGGPMLSGRHRGRAVGSGTDMYRLSEELHAGQIGREQFDAIAEDSNRSVGTCNSMGTASTMACLAEAMGLALPGNGTIPAVDARRRVLARRSGALAVRMVHDDRVMSSIATRAAFDNAARVLAAIGGSTNAVIHLVAFAGRLGISFDLADIDRLGRGVPTLVDVMPAGAGLMDDFFAAGGLQVVLRRLLEAGLLDGSAPTIGGISIGDGARNAACFDDVVIRALANPVHAEGGIAVLRGNLAPDGAVLKVSAASANLLTHRGPAVVFDDYPDYERRVADPAFDVPDDAVLVLRNCGPRGYPGMPELANLGLPPNVLKRGVRDLVRISDARMSGTAYGTVVLHIAPEAAAGGPLALVREGDIIALDLRARRLSLEVDAATLAARSPVTRSPASTQGYERLFRDHVLQADQGCDFDFLTGPRHAGVPPPSL